MELHLQFSWDPEKERENWRKHRVRFRPATRVFLDPNRMEVYDDRHDEDRWTVVGVADATLLVVAYTLRGENDEITRLISARRANAKEKRAYREFQN